MIRMIDKESLDGIITCGKPSGYWIARSEVFPILWTGVVSDVGISTRRQGTFGEVLEWLQMKSGILRDERRDRVIRDSSDTFRGIRVTRGDTVRIPEEDMERAKVYSGFSARKPNVRHTAPPSKDGGMKHGNAVWNKAKLAERDGQIRELVLSAPGMTAKKVAAELGMKEKACAARITILRKAGELPPADPTKLRAPRELQELACGQSPKNAERDVKKFWLPDEDAKIFALLDEGKNAVQIGEALAREMDRTKIAIEHRARRLKKDHR